MSHCQPMIALVADENLIPAYQELGKMMLPLDHKALALHRLEHRIHAAIILAQQAVHRCFAPDRLNGNSAAVDVLEKIGFFPGALFRISLKDRAVFNSVF